MGLENREMKQWIGHSSNCAQKLKGKEADKTKVYMATYSVLQTELPRSLPWDRVNCTGVQNWRLSRRASWRRQYMQNTIEGGKRPQEEDILNSTGHDVWTAWRRRWDMVDRGN